MNGLRSAVSSALEILSGELGFLVGLSLTVFAFIGGLTVILVYGITAKKRLSFLLFAVGVCLTELAVDLSQNSGAFLSLINLGAVVVEFSVISVLPVKKREITQEQREFVRYIDNKVKREAVTEISVKPIENKTNDGDMNIDFSHVKSVIERINACGLSSPDKRIVQALSGSLAEAEKGASSFELKEKINDGLGALLKIMSKYGV